MSLFLGTNKDGSFKTTDSFQHTILFAPTGSGKGVAYILPNLLSCEDSVICHDIKGENYEITKKYRQSIGQKVFFFDPLNQSTNKYNPFDFIEKKDKNKMYSDVEKIAHLLIDKNEIEDVLARRLLIDTALDLLNKNSKTSFGEILEKINQSEEDIAIYLQKYLEPWSNPLVRNATSSSDFDLRKFRDEKSTLYVIVNNNNINRLQPLLKFMYQHFFDILTSQPHDEIKDKSGVRFFLDEFTTLGKMKELELGIGYFRGYKIGLFLTVQNLQQLQSAYGDDAISLINNASFRISFHANDFETANFVSNLCLNQDGFSWKDLISLPKDEMIYFDEHSQAIKQKKFKYFENEEFKKRVDL